MFTVIELTFFSEIEATGSCCNYRVPDLRSRKNYILYVGSGCGGENDEMRTAVLSLMNIRS